VLLFSAIADDIFSGQLLVPQCCGLGVLLLLICAACSHYFVVEQITYSSSSSKGADSVGPTE